MAIDKKFTSLSSFSKAPNTLSPADLNGTDIGDYVRTDYDDGSAVFDFDEDSVERAVMGDVVVNPEDDFYKNLAEDMDEEELNEIASDVFARYNDDKESRSEWLETVSSGLNLLGTRLDEVGGPFPGACTAHHPLILESAVKFQAKAANVLFDSKGPVKTQVIGAVTEEKEAQAARVSDHMNFQIMHQMEEYFDEQESMLFYLPIVGSAFKKTYLDTRLNRPASVFVPVADLVVNYFASNLKDACITHVISISRNDLKKDIMRGFYRDVDLGKAAVVTSERSETAVVIDELTGNQPNQRDEVDTLLEQYIDLQLDNDSEISKEEKDNEIALPYVVTIDVTSMKVLSIRRNWAKLDEDKKKIIPFTHYKFVPGLGFYGLGYVHLLGNLQMTLTSTMRSLVDSGSFSNLQGGFVDRRLRVRDNDGPIAPGQWKEADSGGLPMSQAFFALPFKEPSQVLMQMYKFVEERAQTFADSTEQVISDASTYGPVGTVMALLEASTKFFSGVHKRLHKAQKNEFKILAALNYEYLDDKETFDIPGKTFDISKEDYNGVVDIVPVSDPNLGSQSQRMAQAQAILTSAQQDRQLHNMQYVYRDFYLAMGVDAQKVENMVPQPEQVQPLDPMSDIMMAQQGKPIKAFPDQDHDAHIQLKTAFLQDPASGQNPIMAAIAPRIQANIQEHIVLKFQQMVQGTIANDMQENPEMAMEAQGMPQEMLLAQAASKVAQTNQQLAAAQQQSPDAARMILAQNDSERVKIEKQKADQAVDEAVAKQALEEMNLNLKTYQANMQLTIAEMQTGMQAQLASMKQNFEAAMAAVKHEHAKELQGMNQKHQGEMAAINEKIQTKATETKATVKKDSK